MGLSFRIRLNLERNTDSLHVALGDDPWIASANGVRQQSVYSLHKSVKFGATDATVDSRRCAGTCGIALWRGEEHHGLGGQQMRVPCARLASLQFPFATAEPLSRAVVA